MAFARTADILDSHYIITSQLEGGSWPLMLKQGDSGGTKGRLFCFEPPIPESVSGQSTQPIFLVLILICEPWKS